LGASVHVVQDGVVTCASTGGDLQQYVNRYLRVHLQRKVGSHRADYYGDRWEAHRLIDKALVHPTRSNVHPMEEVGQPAIDVHHNKRQARFGVLILAEQGLSARDQRDRAQHPDAINRFRGR
jgi:crotonyl-CoA reductase